MYCDDDATNSTLYDIVVCDRLSGKRTVVADKEPIRGQYPAQEEIKKLERNNRNPNLYYAAEKSTRRSKDIDEPEGLLTHKFRAH